MVLSPTSCLLALVVRWKNNHSLLKLEELEIVNVLLSSTVGLLTISCKTFIKLSTIRE